MRHKTVSLMLFISMALSLFAQLASAAAGPSIVSVSVGAPAEVMMNGEKFIDTAWFSFSPEEDGWYHFTAMGPYITLTVYDKDTKTELSSFIVDRLYKRSSIAAISGLHVEENRMYLHAGSYLVGVSAQNNATGPITLEIEKIPVRFGGADQEPNESKESAIRLVPGGKVSGVLYGRFDDGSRDDDDWYLMDVAEAGTYSFLMEAELDAKLSMYDAKGNAIDFAGCKNGDSPDTVHDKLDNLYRTECAIELPAAGKYYLRVRVWYVENAPAGCSYRLVEGDGNATQITGGAVQTGTRIQLPALTTGIGFCIYRSEEKGSEGTVIAALVSGTSFVDINVTPGTTYYYTVKEVFAEGDESYASDEIGITTEDEIIGGEIKGKKGFILMRMGDPMMSVNGVLQEIDPGRGTVPVAQSGRTLVPIRAIIEAMNGTVAWDGETQKVTLDAAGHHIEMWLEQKEFVVDGVKKEMDVAPTALNDRTMLPVRFVVENIGCAIEWIGSTQEVVIVFSTEAA